jgi:hypothetical protein
MRFFTPEACDTFDEIEPFRKVNEAYRRHLACLRGVLPESVLELAEPSGMENGLIVQVSRDRTRRILRLVLRCGDLQLGYYNLVLTYKGAELTPEHDDVLAMIARSTETQRSFECDLAYQEVDANEDGSIMHSLIFYGRACPESASARWPWFSIRCRELQWHREPKRTRRLPPSQDRYPGGPVG